MLLESYNTLLEARCEVFIETRAALARLIRCYEQMGRTEDAARLQARLDR